MANVTTQPATLRGQIEAVLERHEGAYAFSQNGRTVCVWCADDDGDYIDHPCDAATMATALLEAVTALEKQHNELDHASAADVNDDTLDQWFVTLNFTLAAIAATLKGADDDR